MGSTPSKLGLIQILNDTIVAEKTDAQFLDDLLRIKLRITTEPSDTKILAFDPSFILEQNDLDFDLVISILEKSLKICSDFSLQLKQIAEYIEKKNAASQSNVLKLLHFMVFYCVKESTTLLYEHIKPSFATKFLIDQLNIPENKDLAYDTLISLFKIYNKSDQIDCLESLYHFCNVRENLDVFCGFLHHIPGEIFYEETSSFTNDAFWIYVESCISGLKSHLQKQGTYLLSKYVAATTSENKMKNIFVSVNTKNSWKAFFFLVDVGREKQLHLIMPALSLLQHLPHLPYLWQKCCYKIYLNHSQSSIVYHVANEILKRSFTGDCLKEIMELVLPALNKNEYSDHSCKVFSSLSVFCSSLGFDDFEIVVDEVAKITWNSVSFWKIVQSVLIQPHTREIFLQSEVSGKILTIALNLPHMHIRDECLASLIPVMWSENVPFKTFKIYQSLVAAGADPLKHLKCLKISGQLINLVMENKHKYSNFDDWFKIFKIANINSWPYAERSLHILSPQTQLFVWRDYLISPCTSTLLYQEIEKFLVTHARYIPEESTDNFIDLFKMSVAKNIVGNNVFMEIIHEPLFSPAKYNENQIYVALVLIQDYLFNKTNLDTKCSQTFSLMWSKISVDFKVNYNKIFIKFVNGNTVSKISVKSSRMCIASINLLSITHKNGSSITTTHGIIDLFENVLEQYDNRVLNVLYAKTLELISPPCSPIIIKDLILLLYKNISQIKKDQYYKDIVNEFIKIVFSERFYKLNIEHEGAIIFLMSKELLNICCLYPILRLNWLKEMRNLVSFTWSYYDICVEPAVELYIQGTVVSKDKRTEYSLCQEIADHQIIKGESCNFDDTGNPNILNAASRLLALDLLSFIGQREAGLVLVINVLKEKYKRSFKERYFVDSTVHYEKLRILQALLVIIFQCELSDIQSQQISAFVLDCFEEENNQNCVKQILHWMLILILKDVSPILSWITSKHNFAPSVLINIIPSLYYLSILGNEETLNKTVNLVLPWTMGAQFKLRVYSQDLVKRLIDHGKEKGYANFIQESKYLETCISNCITTSGDNFTNTLKTDLVFLNHFHPVKDKSWSMALGEISRLNKVHSSEWQNLRAFIANPSLLRVRFLTKNIKLQSKIPSFSEAVDAFLLRTESPPEPTKETNFDIPHIQRKIAPWKSTLENPKVKTSDFVLITSLIEKSQNLGGLSRTCEVFGIKDIVFNDANVIIDKEFKSLSMSSESWINAIEVKVPNLSLYIRYLQREGYCVVGAEQTAGSSKLDQYNFPKKTALVLGHEKTGIPTEIIPLLNVCIEIPQFGQTRSLNVHVAGAMFIWEYAKQHSETHNNQYAFSFSSES